MVEKISSCLDAIDFSDLFYGFEKQQYIVADKPAGIFINGIKSSFDEINLENSVYKIKGINFATWNMNHNQDTWDMIDITCGIIHEMFHCYQINTGIVTSDILNDTYTNKNIKEQLELIKNIIEESDQKKQIILFYNFLKYRLINFSLDAIEIMSQVEQIEGVALYVELLSKSKITNKPLEEYLNDYYNYLINLEKNKFFILSHYFIGAGIAVYLNMNIEEWQKDYILSDRYYFNLYKLNK